VEVRVGGKKREKVGLEGEGVALKPLEVLKGTQRAKLVRTYTLHTDDQTWAAQGVVATIINGEAVPLVQQRVVYAGFNNLDIIPLGADKVFVRSLTTEDVMAIIDGAAQFFHHF
ncbi:sulfate transporter, partial [Trifolium medium]|nr:sulfate transporter [Trifolium medium]